MSEMVERVAKAIYKQAVGHEPEPGEMAPHWLGHAKAAIEAMREPTREMLERGLMDGTNLTTGQPSARLAARNAGERMADQWRGMIAAALLSP